MRQLCKNAKAILVVNVASAWGLTDSNYKALVQIHQKYKDQGL
jgi:glutathione peroxidase-family protein